MNKAALTLPFAGVCLGLSSAGALGAGFQLLEQNVSGLGTAYAGSAAVAEDASTVFFNPAGMAFLPAGSKNIVIGVNAIKPSTKFSDGGTTAALLNVGNPYTATPGTSQSLGGDGGDAGSLAPVPNAYVVVPINQNVSFGLGIGAPFGLKTEYDSGWAGRFQGLKSEVKTVNINPSLSWKLNETTSLGFGLDYEKLTGEFTSATNYSAAILGAFQAGLLAPFGLAYPTLSTDPTLASGAIDGANGLASAAGEGTAKLSGSDTAWGYNLGAMFKVSEATRIGISYRSAIKFHLTGNADFSRTASGSVNAIIGSATSAARGGPIYADIKLPDTFIVSGMTHFDNKWDIVGDLSWTGWAKIPTLAFQYANNGSTVSSTPENWRNTWRVALGGIYKTTDTMKWKMGIAYDQSPVSDTFRTVRLPDNDRLWLSVGAQYQLSKGSTLDWAYAHLFVKDAPINNNAGNAAGYAQLNGSYKDSVDILGVQYAVSF